MATRLLELFNWNSRQSLLISVMPPIRGANIRQSHSTSTNRANKSYSQSDMSYKFLSNCRYSIINFQVLISAAIDWSYNLELRRRLEAQKPFFQGPDREARPSLDKALIFSASCDDPKAIVEAELHLFGATRQLFSCVVKVAANQPRSHLVIKSRSTRLGLVPLDRQISAHAILRHIPFTTTHTLCKIDRWNALP